MKFCRILFFFIFLTPFLIACKAKHKTTVLTDRDLMEHSTVMIQAFENLITGNEKKAFQLFQYVMQKNHAHAASRYYAARILSNQYQYNQAIELIQQAIKIDPENIWYKYFLIELYKKTGEKKKIIPIYEQLLKQVSNDPNLYFDLSMAYLQVLDIRNAIRILDEFEKKYGMVEEIIQQKYRLYLFSNNKTKALEELQKMELLDPYNTEYLMMIGKHYMQTGSISHATEYFDRVLSIEPHNIEAIIHLLNAYLILNNIEKFEQTLLNLCADSLINIDEKIMIFLDLFQATNLQSSLMNAVYKALDTLINTHPEEPKAHSIYGDFLYRDEQYDRASEKYKQVLKLDDTKYQVWENLLVCFEMRENWDSIYAYATRAIELFPEHYKFYLYTGFALYQQKNYTSAIPYLEQALVLNSSDKQIRFITMFALAESQYHSGNYDEAFAMFEQIITDYPTNYVVLNNYSYYLALQKRDLDKALKYSEKTLKANPKNPHYLDTYGWILYQMGKYEEAEKYISRAIEVMNEPIPQIFENYGDVLLQLGRIDEAVTYWRKAADAGMDDPGLKQKLLQYEKN